jgi:hypothetical protein
MIVKGLKKEEGQMKVICVFVWIIPFFLGSLGFADSLRCGNRVISKGDSKIEVLAKCGQPDMKEVDSYDTTGTVSRSGNVSLKTSTVERFYYNCGEGRFLRVLIFVEGRLTAIKNAGSYGSGPVKCE